jgi:hypothetical protein
MPRIETNSPVGFHGEASPAAESSTATSRPQSVRSSSLGLEPRQSSTPASAANVRRTASLPPPGSEYQLPRHTAVTGPNPQTLYHVTSQGNAESIRDTGGLMPLAHQPKPGGGLDAMRGHSGGGVNDTVSTHLTAVSEVKQYGVSASDQEMLLRSTRGQAADVMKNGSNSQTVYMGTEDSVKDYLMTDAHVRGAVLMKAEIDPAANRFVKDIQGGSGDQRSLGLTVPSSKLQYAKLDSNQVQSVSNDLTPMKDLNWKPLPKPGESL